jgi:DNA-binding SARP family transcriptional activator
MLSGAPQAGVKPGVKSNRANALSAIPPLRLTLLGTPALHAAHGARIAVRRKLLAVLGYLYAHPRGVSRAALASCFWGAMPEERARQSLRQALLELGRAVGPALAAGPERVTLEAAAFACDLRALEDALARGDAAAAADAWGGPLLSGADDTGGAEFDTWLTRERGRLARALDAALAAAVERAAEAGEGDAALALAERWSTLAERSPAAAAARARLLAAAGRIAEAESALAEARRRAEQEGAGEDPAVTRAELALGGARRATPPSAAGSAAAPLVGRAAPLAVLVDAWRAAARGDAAAVAVTAGLGMGRTRLLAELQRWLAARDAPPACLLRGAPGGDATVALLAPLAGAPGLMGAPDDALADVAERVPELRTRWPSLPARPQGPVALPASVRAVVEAVAFEGPVAVLVDDAELLPAETRALVEALAAAPPAGTVVVLAACDGARAWPIAGLRRVRLEPLAPAQTASLLQSIAPATGDLGADAVHHASGGVPLFALAEAEARWPGAAPGAPEAARAAAARAVDGLDAVDRRVAAAVAVLDGGAGAPAVAAAAGIEVAAACDAIDRLYARGLLRRDGSGAEFAHALVREAVLAGVAPATREELRRRAASTPHETARPAPGKRWRRWAVAAAAAVGLLPVGAAVRARLAPASPPVLAVGTVRDLSRLPDAGAARLLPDLLASELARVSGLQVVSMTRLYELSTHAPAAGDPGAAAAAAARRAGAGELVEGTIYAEGPHTLRLDLRRVDLRTGVVRQVASVGGGNPFVLAQRAADQLARDLGAAPPASEHPATSSAVALGFYQEALRAYYQGDEAGARRLFAAALGRDSTFAMAAFYLSRTLEGPARASDLAREHATDAERLLVQGSWAADRDDPSQLAVAETLAIRYPTDPDGHMLYGNALISAGKFGPAAAQFRQVIRMDSAGVALDGARCRACDAYFGLRDALMLADSLAASEAAVRAWIRRQPTSARAWSALGLPLVFQGRQDEADSSSWAAARLSGRQPQMDEAVESALRGGRFVQADSMVALLRHGSAEARESAEWDAVLVYRAQGRLRDALAAADRYRALATPPGASPSQRLQAARPRALVLGEMGRHREAAALWDSLASYDFMPGSASRNGRQRAWELTHEADERYAAGDTAAVARLVPEVARLGALSAYARDQRLHHHLRGLLWMARGRPDEAAAEFRAATYSLWAGHARTNLELGRALLAAGRAAEAVAPLAAQVHGPAGATGSYATFTEGRVLLGEAYERSGQPARAAAEYRWVLAAWANADPPLVPRREAVRARLAALTPRLAAR